MPRCAVRWRCTDARDEPMPLITTPHFEAADGFYEALIDAHRELSAAQSHELNAKLVLLLANHVGERQALNEALAAARASVLHAGASTDAGVLHTDPNKDST
jgi:hypothetical protein